MTFQRIGILRQPYLAVSFNAGAKKVGRRAYNLGQVEGIVADCVEDQILKLVDNVQQILTQRSHLYRSFAAFPTSFSVKFTS